MIRKTGGMRRFFRHTGLYIIIHEDFIWLSLPVSKESSSTNASGAVTASRTFVGGGTLSF